MLGKPLQLLPAQHVLAAEDHGQTAIVDAEATTCTLLDHQLVLLASQPMPLLAVVVAVAMAVAAVFTRNESSRLPHPWSGHSTVMRRGRVVLACNRRTTSAQSRSKIIHTRTPYPGLASVCMYSNTQTSGV